MTEAVAVYEPNPVATEQVGILPVDVDQAIAEWEAYQTLTRRLLDKSDYQGIGSKSFKKKSAWRKYAKAFNLSCAIVEKHVERDDGGKIIYADFIVRATAPSGRYTEAWASCSRSERQFSHDQDIAATAQTRAENRAISDLIGAGEVSAEEMISEKEAERRQARPSPPKGQERADPRVKADDQTVVCEHGVTLGARANVYAAAQKKGASFDVCTCCEGPAPVGANLCKWCQPRPSEDQTDSA